MRTFWQSFGLIVAAHLPISCVLVSSPCMLSENNILCRTSDSALLFMQELSSNDATLPTSLHVDCEMSNAVVVNVTPFICSAIAFVGRITISQCFINFDADNLTCLETRAANLTLSNNRLQSFNHSDALNGIQYLLPKILYFSLKNNSLLDANLSDFVPFTHFDFEQAYQCINQMSLCICTVRQVDNSVLVDVFCFYLSAKEVLGVLDQLHSTARKVQSIKLYGMIFTDHSASAAGSLKLTRAYNKVLDEYLNEFVIHSCGDIANNVSAREQIRSIAKPFEGYQVLQESQELLPWHKLQIAAIVNCPRLNALAAIDGDRLPPDYRVNKQQSLILITYAQVAEVDLSRNNLTWDIIQTHFDQTPIFESKLINLDLSYNFFPEVEEFFLWFPAAVLRKLNWRMCNIKHIATNAFEPLNLLEWLDLSYNQLSCVVAAWFVVLPKLQYLDLSNNNIYGVLAKTFTPYPIWPQSLTHLNLSNNSLIHTDDSVYNGKVKIHFTERFFRGLDNLTHLSLSLTTSHIHTTHFKRLRSVQVLNLNTRAIVEGFTNLTTQLFHTVSSTRVLTLPACVFPKSEIYTAPCQLLDSLRLLNQLIFNDELCRIPGSVPRWPSCETTSRLYDWLQERLRRGLIVSNTEALRCMISSDKTVKTMRYWDDVSTLRPIPFAPNVTLTNNGEESKNSNIKVKAANNDVHKPVEIHQLLLHQVQQPLLIIAGISAVVLFMIIPWRRRKNSQRPISISNVENGTQNIHRLSFAELRGEFMSSTYINGLEYAYASKHPIEKLVWYISVAFFTGLFVRDACYLYVSFAYDEPYTQISASNIATFDQKPFTICIPVKLRNVEFSPTDIQKILAKSSCDTAENRELSLDNPIVMATLLRRISIQYRFVATTLKVSLNSATVQDAISVDTALRTWNMTIRDARRAVSVNLCKRMAFKAWTLTVKDSSQKDVLTLEKCVNIFQNDSYGITWYDEHESKLMCVRFPGLFTFEGYTVKQYFSFESLQDFYDKEHAVLDLNGYDDPVSAGQPFPIYLSLHRTTALDLEVTAFLQNMEYYRTNVRRCYNNCVGYNRVNAIQKQCKCRPLLWSSISDPTMPGCTLVDYQNCNISDTADSHECLGKVPCEFWEYGARSSTLGLTADNSTIVRFDGVNSLYLKYRQMPKQSLSDFLAEVGGVLGLWLGASVMAGVHVAIYLLKMMIAACHALVVSLSATR